MTALLVYEVEDFHRADFETRTLLTALMETNGIDPMDCARIVVTPESVWFRIYERSESGHFFYVNPEEPPYKRVLVHREERRPRIVSP